MGEPKAFASLSSGLLARKGAARPAMRPQGFGQVGSHGLEDLGWNDMGFEPPKPADGPEPDATHDAFGAEIELHPTRKPLAGLTPVGSPVHDQQDEIAGRLAEASDEGEELDETAEIYEPDVEQAAPIEITARETEAESEEAVARVIPAPPVAVVRPVARRAPAQRSAAGSKDKAAFTLRLDKERHLKLRLACAVQGRSAQQLVTQALDELLAGIPELDSLAERAPRAPKAQR
jgi:hypothetical protein